MPSCFDPGLARCSICILDHRRSAGRGRTGRFELRAAVQRSKSRRMGQRELRPQYLERPRRNDLLYGKSDRRAAHNAHVSELHSGSRMAPPASAGQCGNLCLGRRAAGARSAFSSRGRSAGAGRTRRRGFTSDGDVFPIHGATMVPVNGRGGMRAFPSEKRSHPSPQWNHYRIECIDGTLRLAVNGKVVTRGLAMQPAQRLHLPGIGRLARRIPQPADQGTARRRVAGRPGRRSRSRLCQSLQWSRAERLASPFRIGRTLAPTATGFWRMTARQPATIDTCGAKRRLAISS